MLATNLFGLGKTKFLIILWSFCKNVILWNSWMRMLSFEWDASGHIICKSWLFTSQVLLHVDFLVFKMEFVMLHLRLSGAQSSGPLRKGTKSCVCSSGSCLELSKKNHLGTGLLLFSPPLLGWGIWVVPAREDLPSSEDLWPRG